MQTPRFCGFCSIAGTLDLAFCGVRPLRTSWLIVGINSLHRCFGGNMQDDHEDGGLRLYRHPSESWDPVRQAQKACLVEIPACAGMTTRAETLHPDNRPAPKKGGHRVTLTDAAATPPRTTPQRKLGSQHGLEPIEKVSLRRERPAGRTGNVQLYC